ncbi:MAG: hypothetical protein LBC30_01535 [Puniceicoccales bacterium]|jgi:hypothetical protein|nr:hypothetical protein [Puniceicoccales bacterium]
MGAPDKIKGGFRGRDVSTQVAGHPKPHKQIFPDQGPAEIRGKLVGDCLELPKLEGGAKTFFQAVRADGGFNRPFRPQQSATPDVIDPHRVAMLNDPVRFLQEALSAPGEADQAANASLVSKLGERKVAIQKQLQTALLDTKFPDELGNPPTLRRAIIPWQIRDLVDGADTPGPRLCLVKSKPSFAASMIDHGLQTFCSISGTTTDIVVGMVAQMGGDPAGKAAMAGRLGPLVELVESAVVATPSTTSEQLAGQIANDPKLNGFKDLFLSISLYMQSGQYHTASEVLAGLYCAALNVCPQSFRYPSTSPVTDPKAFGERFERLCAVFQSNPVAFFPAAPKSRAA